MATECNTGTCIDHLFLRCWHDCSCENKDPECDNIPTCIFCKGKVIT